MKKVYIYAPLAALIAPAVFFDAPEIAFKLICCSSVITAGATIALLQADTLFSFRQKDNSHTNRPHTENK